MAIFTSERRTGSPSAAQATDGRERPAEVGDEDFDGAGIVIQGCRGATVRTTHMDVLVSWEAGCWE